MALQATLSLQGSNTYNMFNLAMINCSKRVKPALAAQVVPLKPARSTLTVSQAMSYDRAANETKKRVVALAITLYYDTLQVWWIRDYLEWCDEQDRKRREWWAGEGWTRRVQQIQEEVYADELERKQRIKAKKKASKVRRRYYEYCERRRYYEWYR